MHRIQPQIPKQEKKPQLILAPLLVNPMLAQRGAHPAVVERHLVPSLTVQGVILAVLLQNRNLEFSRPSINIQESVL